MSADVKIVLCDAEDTAISICAEIGNGVYLRVWEGAHVHPCDFQFQMGFSDDEIVERLRDAANQIEALNMNGHRR